MMCLFLLVFAASITAQKSPLLPVNGVRPQIAFAGSSVSMVQEQGNRGKAKVDGIVRDRFQRNEPVPNALVKLFPDPPSAEHPDLIRSARTDQLGNFEIDDVAPGKYRIVAFMGGGPEDL